MNLILKLNEFSNEFCLYVTTTLSTCINLENVEL